MRSRRNTKPNPQPKTEIREVTFRGIASGGDGVGRDETGMTVFAPFGVPGDQASVRTLGGKKGFARGQIQTLKVLGPGRREPRCRYFRPEVPNQSCGGCQIQHLDYQTQLQVKRQFVVDALERIGHFRGDTAVHVEECLSSPEEWNYRNKADFVVGLRQGRPEVGFFARESHHLIDIEQCPIQADLNNHALEVIRGILGVRPDWAFDPASGRGELRRIVLRSTSGGACHVLLATQRPRWLEANEFAAQLMSKLPAVTGVSQRQEGEFAREPHLIKGAGTVEESVGAHPLTVRGEAFLQVNPGVTRLMVQTAMGMAEITPGTRALDLYCGVGLFALEMAEAGASVKGFEANPGAILSARENAARLGLVAEFIVGDVASELQTLAPDCQDLILLDPPRAGAAEAVPHLLRLAPAQIIYVSCDPATLARDLRPLVEGGYRIEKVVPLDMFPQTAHVETVVKLARG